MSFCSNCGKETIPGDLYCEGCGISYDQFENQSRDRDQVTTRVASDDNKPGKKQGKGFRRFLFILLVIALSAGAYYVKLNRPPGNPVSTGDKLNSPVEQPAVAVNEGVQTDTIPSFDSKPAETANQTQKTVSAPDEVEKENPAPSATTAKPGVPAKNKLPAKSTDSKKTVVIFSTWNNNGLLLNNPVVERIKWNITKKVMITRVTTYHWNGGKGDPGGGSLTFTGPKDHGPFRVVRMEAGDDGTPNAKWIFEPGIILSPGKYRIEQTGKRTLSHNIGSAGQGFVKIEGYYTGQ